ncbi:MAG: toll/interleukin-1 receptor domain-containing protein, partial [Firmicutes bacterium]|nr:toll/interleukin-1 receptor domain-containing protein [Bacillota bacterium]
MESQDKLIFISHSSRDEAIVKCFVNFLVANAIPDKTIFCSSHPGYGVETKIAPEVFRALKNSKIDIVILSRDYYESAYCRDELGAIWLKEKSNNVTIALPEITEKNMRGFYDSQNKIHRLEEKHSLKTIFSTIGRAIGSTFSQGNEAFDAIADLFIKGFKSTLKEREADYAKDISGIWYGIATAAKEEEFPNYIRVALFTIERKSDDSFYVHVVSRKPSKTKAGRVNFDSSEYDFEKEHAPSIGSGYLYRKPDKQTNFHGMFDFQRRFVARSSSHHDINLLNSQHMLGQY